MRQHITFGELYVKLFSIAAASKGEGKNGQAEVEKRQIMNSCVLGWDLPEIRPVVHLEYDPRKHW